MTRKLITYLLLLMFSVSTTFATSEIEALKSDILTLAESFRGEGDPDLSKQKAIDVYVNQLLKLKPQVPVKERLPLLYGAWEQVWGPYDYRSKKRGVDPELDADNIFQVIFKGGYYYNVSYKLDRAGRIKNTTLLRGEFKLDEKNQNALKVKFTNLRKINGTQPANLKLIDLPALSEARKLEGEKVVLPSFIVRLTFGGGTLNEVYTDEDLRILYGTGSDESVSNYLYILKRAD